MKLNTICIKFHSKKLYTCAMAPFPKIRDLVGIVPIVPGNMLES